MNSALQPNIKAAEVAFGVPFFEETKFRLENYIHFLIDHKGSPNLLALIVFQTRSRSQQIYSQNLVINGQGFISESEEASVPLPSY